MPFLFNIPAAIPAQHKNIKADTHVLRVAYYFDKVRSAFLLIGGDKKGKDSKKFYSVLIRTAEAIIAQHEKELEK